MNCIYCGRSLHKEYDCLRVCYEHIHPIHHYHHHHTDTFYNKIIFKFIFDNINYSIEIDVLKSVILICKSVFKPGLYLPLTYVSPATIQNQFAKWILLA